MKYSETSIIAGIYTEERGMRSYIISGVRSKKAKVKASLLQVMSIVDMVAYDRQEKGLNRVRELQAAYVYQSLPFDVRKSAVGLFMTELAQKTIREPEENKRLFEFLFRTFRFLDQTTGPIANLHLYFLLELSSFLGFVPAEEWSEATPIFDLQEGVFVAKPPPHAHYIREEGSLLLHQLLEKRMETCHELQMQRSQRKALLRNLIDYYRLHIENLPELYAHEVLQEVLDD